MIIAATGHRPPQDFAQAKIALNAFMKLACNNVTYAITGMADGWDTIFARACLYYGVPLHCYVPFRGQKPTSEFYGEILGKAASIIYCADAYHKRCFLDRDDRMVQDADLLIAFLSPESKKGGTFYTVKKGRGAGKPVINFY